MTVPQGGTAKFCCFFVKIAMCTIVTSAGEISTGDVYRRKLSLIHVYPPFCLVHVLELGTTVWVWRSDDNVERPVLSFYHRSSRIQLSLSALVTSIFTHLTVLRPLGVFLTRHPNNSNTFGFKYPVDI